MPTVARPPSEPGDLLSFLDAAPSPYHAVAEAERRLTAAGSRLLDERAAWSDVTGRAHVVRGATLVAWHLPGGRALDQGFCLVGAHTDSPNLRVKPRPDTGTAGYRQIGVEVYGGALWNSWLDRDLALSGRVAVRTADGVTTMLLRVEHPVARIPQLAIHLDRGVNEQGLRLNPQQHLAPVWATGPTVPGSFAEFVAESVGVATDDVLGWDLMFDDPTPATLLGAHDEFVSSGRIDNLVSCWAAVTAMASAEPTGAVPVIALFDHEEVGSETASGAASSVLSTVLERVVHAAGGDRPAFLRALASSRCVSADGAHATNPNWPERHEPAHQVHIDGGPVIKTNSNARYATDAETAAWFRAVCGDAGVPVQEFVVRSDLPCGSTIGPITAARLGVPTVDVGVAQLAMHSARELCGARDPVRLARALQACFSSQP